MSNPGEVASRAFLEALIEKVQGDASHKDVEYMIDELFPVVIPAITHLLHARAGNLSGRTDDDDDGIVQPMDHLAKYLFRHNPRHTTPTAEMIEIQAAARKLLRK